MKRPQDVLDNYESVYMNAYKDSGFKLLNIRDAGSRGLHSEESKNKISEGLKRTGHTHERRLGASERMKEMSLSPNRILNCSKGGKANIGGKRSAEVIEKFRSVRPNNMSILCYDVNGVLIGKFISQSACARSRRGFVYKIV